MMPRKNDAELAGLEVEGVEGRKVVDAQLPEGLANVRAILERAIAISGKSKSAFANAAGMSPRQLWTYLKPNGSEMGVRNINRVLEANGLTLEVNMRPENPNIREPQQEKKDSSNKPTIKRLVTQASTESWQWRSMYDDNDTGMMR